MWISMTRVVAVLSLLFLTVNGSPVEAATAIPAPTGATLLESKDLADGGHKRAFETSESAVDLLSSYAKLLEAGGWTITRRGAGSGQAGGGAELDANLDGRHLVLTAGGPKGRTFVGICVWPERPENDYCG